MSERRRASEGPYLNDSTKFIDWCKSEGIETRPQPGFMFRGYLIKYGKHWMGLLYNKSFKRYTADKRLQPLINKFKG